MAMGVRLSGLVLAACAGAPRTVPITIGPAHELVVPVVVNGEELELQLDTGASTTTIMPAVRTRLKLHTLDRVTGAGAAGRIGEVDRVVFDTTEIAGTPVFRILSAVIDHGGTSDGLLGMDALRQVTTEIDLVHDRLTIYDRDDRSWLTPDLVALPVTELAGGQLVIEIQIGGRPASAIVDLGANQSFANRLAAPARDDAARLVTATVGADGHPWRFHAFGDTPLEVGGVALVAPALLVADLPIFGELGIASGPAVIIGADLLAGRRIVIDPSAHRVYFSRTASPVAPQAVPLRLRLV